MEKFKGTPGPWEVYIGWNQDGVASTESGISICRISRHLTEEEKANARLISKAPELLEAMQEFCDRVDKGEVRSTKTYNKFKELIKQATEAKPRPSPSPAPFSTMMTQ